MDQRKTNLIKNTIILAIGNFSSKLLSFFLVPLYSFYLKPAEYGEIDIYLTILWMCYILFSLQSVESSFRFIQDCKNEQEKARTISNAFIIALFGTVILTVGILLIDHYISFDYSLIFILHVSTNVFANLLIQTIRGMNKINIYAVIGVISTVIHIFANIMLIVGFGVGANSLLYVPIIANTSIILITILTTDITKYINFSEVEKGEIKEQLKFSLPLIPNAIGIWMLSSIGRFILLYYYGTAEVGILTFTLKFPYLLSMVNSIFFMAWQTSSISEYNSIDRDKFASDIFKQFSGLLLSAIIILLPIIKILIFTIVSDSYKKAWIYVPLFIGGIFFNAYTQFFSMGFYGAKKTNTLLSSTLISCMLYLIIGLFTINNMGIFGVGIAYLLAELANYLIVKKRVSPFMKVTINMKHQVLLFSLIFINITIYYLAGLFIQIILVIVNIIFALIINRELLKDLVSTLRLSIKKTRLID